MGNPEMVKHTKDTDYSDPISNPVLDELRYADRGEDKQHVILGLERRYRAMQFFMGRAGLEEGQDPTENQKRWQDVDEQFRRHISAILASKRKDKTTDKEYYLYPDADSAWERFERWKKEASTEQQRDAMSMEQEEFTELFLATRAYLDKEEEEIVEAVKGRLQKNRDAEKLYENQTDKNYEKLKNSGIEIEINHKFLEELKKRSDPEYLGPDRIDLDSGTPLLEQIKTERGLTVEGLEDSKVSLAIHDSFDHLWLMSQLEKHGVLTKYADFLQKIGKPLWRDVFGREGEVVASIGYSYRYSKEAKGIEPYFSFDQIQKILEKGIERGLDPEWSRIDESQVENMQEALDILESLPDILSQNSLAFSFSNYAVEFMEQIRKHGNVKIQNEEGKFIDKLSPVDPEMLAFFIQCFNLLQNPVYKSENTLVKLELMIEQRLVDAIKGTGPSSFTVRLEDLESPELNLEDSKTRWFKDNLGFAATRRRIGL
jgi:hypothetical protein